MFEKFVAALDVLVTAQSRRLEAEEQARQTAPVAEQTVTTEAKPRRAAAKRATGTSAGNAAGGTRARTSSGTRTTAKRTAKSAAAKPASATKRRAAKPPIDEVDEAAQESFPASDPPAFNP